jgi:glycogen debranching enzyme GlgX/4-alpha-glucanotransferase
MTWAGPPDGDPEPLGVTPRGDGVNVAVFSANATAIEFCLFEGEREVRRVRLHGRTGDVFHDHIPDVSAGARYGLRAHGPFLPREGHRFNAAKLLIDPYARLIDRPFALHPSMFGYRPDTPDNGSSFSDIDSAPFVPKGIVLRPETSAEFTRPITPWPRTVLYELHIRGFTAAHPDIPEIMRGRYAGLAHPAAIEHLVRLGITTVEIMPSAAWIEERHLAARGSRNYWGYNPIALMAPDPGLAPGGWDEIRAATATLGAAGIEVILDVVLNHSGEGDALGPTLSLRGLDNATYYRSLPGPSWRYADHTGCGNTIALDRPAPLRLAMDALRTWAVRAGVHGFRFDLATTMGRREDGFDPAAPLLSSIAQDPVLRDLKLIAEPWDVGPGGYRLGEFPAAWGEWNDRFRDHVRLFWRGDPDRLGDLATRLAGSADLFAARCVASRSVNFVVAHDGFTLADLVSYTSKVNAANGEDNRDGTDANYSWNNGVEGPSGDSVIVAARARDQRALLATLVLARGTPMLAMGSEFGHSQGGNNNAYALDDSTVWLDWAAGDAGLLAWTRELLRIRRDQPLLHGDRFLTGLPCDVSLLPDVEWRDAAGDVMTQEAWQERDGTLLVMMLAGAIETEDATDRLAIILHRGMLDHEVTLPPARAAYAWHLIADSAVGAGDAAKSRAGASPVARVTGQTLSEPAFNGATTTIHEAATEPVACDLTITVAARSVLVLVERRRNSRAAASADPGLLDRLSRAAGIAPEWWDVNGQRTIVSEDTRRALLASMRLPAASEGEARDTLRRLSDSHDRRALPHAVVSRVGEPTVLCLGVEPILGPGPVWLTVEREDGETERIRLGADDGELIAFTGLDGLPARAWRVSLPVLPEGRHRLRRGDVPDIVCHLTVAPRRCYLPDPIRRGGKRFGISAQLYALRRNDDQGIGDFTTLAMLAEAAARERATTIGINPLHMLFPGDRERASPYHPSDRRFLDPIYLDVADGGADPGSEAARVIIRDHVARAGAALTRDVVAYSEVWALKRAVLERRFAAFVASDNAGAPLIADFHRFINEGGPDLWRFAAFQAIAETRPGETWRQWPDGLRSPDSGAVAAFAEAHAERLRFHQYLQFLADRQLAAAAAKGAASGLELGLFRDLAVGAAPDGAEAWARSEDLAEGAWIGAPPDPFTVEGQNWHLPPPLPLRFAQTGFASFAALIAANMRHAGALRIDHAMGLTRLFWIPDGGTGADGAYVAYPIEDLLGQLALESVRAGCMVIGEDLGTVPEGFRATMSESDILSYRVLLLEREGRRFRPASSYPVRSVACVTTHDLPPLAGWWEGTDLRERAALGLLRPGSDAEGGRAPDRTALVETLADEGCLVWSEVGNPPVDIVVAGAHAFVASTPCDLVLVQADDLAGMRVGVNLPGTDAERPNWRLRLPVPVETLLSGVGAREILTRMRAKGRGTTRGSGDAQEAPDATGSNPMSLDH